MALGYDLGALPVEIIYDVSCLLSDCLKMVLHLLTSLCCRYYPDCIRRIYYTSRGCRMALTGLFSPAQRNMFGEGPLPTWASIPARRR